MAVNGKNKGNTFERKVAKLLSDRFAEYLGIESGFRRNPDSGSYFGGSNVKRSETHSLDYAIFGDLICPRNFVYSVECKHYKTAPSLQSILAQEVKQWDDWLLQAQQDSDTSGKKLALIIKYNNVSEFVFLAEPITGITSIINYKQYFAYKLGTFLDNPTESFFTVVT